MEKKRDNDGVIWQPISDIMTGLMLVFILFLVVVTYQSLKQKNELSAQILDFLEKRERIIERLIVMKETLKDQGILVCVDEHDGTVSIPSDNLFDTGQHELQERGSHKSEKRTGFDCEGRKAEFKSIDSRRALEAFFLEYFPIVFDNQYEAYVGSVSIEGHADPQVFDTVRSRSECAQRINESKDKVVEMSTRSDLANFCLSALRADSVYRFLWTLLENRQSTLANRMIESNSTHHSANEGTWTTVFKERIIIAGRGNAHPKIMDGRSEEENFALSRRVEFKFSVQDREGIRRLVNR